MNIDTFMKLPDAEKENYLNRYYPCPENRKEYDDYDIKVFSSEDLQFTDIPTPHCEMCDSLEQKYIGTPDTREPKFCFVHYAEINKDSEFIALPIEKSGKNL